MIAMGYSEIATAYGCHEYVMWVLVDLHVTLLPKTAVLQRLLLGPCIALYPVVHAVRSSACCGLLCTLCTAMPCCACYGLPCTSHTSMPSLACCACCAHPAQFGMLRVAVAC